jgi:haloalkane dehalogenase
VSAAGLSARPGWLSSELYPFETKLAGGLNHIDVGSGPTLLFVHGNPTWSFLYREIVRGLMDDFRCIAVDLPGFGLSEPPEGFRFTPLEHALALERFVVEADLTDVTLMGQDWGGPIGFAVAGWQPQRFGGFVVGNTWAWPLPGLPARAWSLFASSPAARLFPDRGMQAGSRRTTLSEDVLEHYRRPARTEAVQALGAAVAGAKPFLAEVERGLEGLRDRPALITWPTADPLFRAPFRVRWEQLFADHRTVELPGAGHFIQEDAPEEIVTAIREWTSLS